MAPYTGLSKRTRTVIFTLLVCTFFIATPLVWFYANGYRLVHTETENGGERSFVQTGGIFVAVEEVGTLYIDEEAVRGSRFFSGGRYVDGVPKGVHRVHVQREDAHTWVKELTVLPQFVTDAHAFNVPLEPEVVLLEPGDSEYDVAYDAFLAPEEPATTTPSATPVQLSDLQENVHAIFSPEESIETRDPYEVLAESNGMQLVAKDGKYFARYIGGRTKIPSYFCPRTEVTTQATSTPSVHMTACSPIVELDTQGHVVRDIAFAPDTTDLVILGRDDGIFLTEIDNRGGWQNTQPILEGGNLSFAIADGELYVMREATDELLHIPLEI